MPIQFAVLKVAQRWGVPPSQVEPGHGRGPRDDRWFWWTLDMMSLEASVGPGAPAPETQAVREVEF